MKRTIHEDEYGVRIVANGIIWRPRGPGSWAPFRSAYKMGDRVKIGTYAPTYETLKVGEETWLMDRYVNS